MELKQTNFLTWKIRMELIEISQRELVPGTTVEAVNARDLWKFVESKRDFSDWIKERLSSELYTESEDWVVHKFMVNPKGGRPTIDYYLTIDMAKELGLAEHNEKGQQLRRWFIAREKKLRSIEATGVTLDLSNTESVLDTLISLATAYRDEKNKSTALESKVVEQAPKVAALDRIASVEIGEMSVTEAAKVLQTGRDRLFEFLAFHGWIYRTKRRWVAYQKMIERGVLKHHIYVQSENGQEDRARPSVLVTPKGLTELAILLGRKPGQMQFDLSP